MPRRSCWHVRGNRPEFGPRERNLLFPVTVSNLQGIGSSITSEAVLFAWIAMLDFTLRASSARASSLTAKRWSARCSSMGVVWFDGDYVNTVNDSPSLGRPFRRPWSFSTMTSK